MAGHASTYTVLNPDGEAIRGDDNFEDLKLLTPPGGRIVARDSQVLWTAPLTITAPKTKETE